MKIIFVGGNKGGVAKSLTSHLAVYALLHRCTSAVKLAVIDCDASIGDVFPVYADRSDVLSRSVNLNAVDGYDQYFTLLMEIEASNCTHVVVNSFAGDSAGSVEQLSERHTAVTAALAELGMSMVYFFVVLDSHPCADSLFAALGYLDPQTLVVIKNHFNGSKFEVINQLIDPPVRSIDLPVLKPALTAELGLDGQDVSAAIAVLKSRNPFTAASVQAAVNKVADLLLGVI